jgi:uncharacterized protein
MFKKVIFLALILLHANACTNTGSNLSSQETIFENEKISSLKDKATANRVNKPFIWKITSAKGRSSFLFGTIHIGVPIGKLPWHVHTKLRETNTLVVEANPKLISSESGDTDNSPIQKILRKHQKELMLPDGESLQDKISEEAFNILISDTRLPPTFLEGLTPYGAKFFYEFMSFAISLTMVPDGNLDEEMVSKAQSSSIKLNFLETPKDVDSYLPTALGFNSEEAETFSADNLNEFLINDAQDSREEMLKGMFSLIIAYKSGDMANLKLQADKQLNAAPRMKEMLIDQRNVKWLKKLRPKLNKGSSFVAVGVMHMPGKTGLISLLRKEGYKVERL